MINDSKIVRSIGGTLHTAVPDAPTESSGGRCAAACSLPWWQKGSIAAGVLCLLLGLPLPAHATNFSGATGLTGCTVNMADNGDHYVWYNALTAPTAAALNVARTSLYNPTDLNTYTEDVLTTQTDVDAYDGDYETSTCGVTWASVPNGPGMWGLVRCARVVVSNSKCDQQRVDFDTDFMGPQTTANENWLACHEFGHTIGLLHTNTGSNCMQSPNVGTASLTSHDINDHINARY